MYSYNNPVEGFFYAIAFVGYIIISPLALLLTFLLVGLLYLVQLFFNSGIFTFIMFFILAIILILIYREYILKYERCLFISEEDCKSWRNSLFSNTTKQPVNIPKQN